MATGLNFGGWIFLIFGWGFILFFTFYCFNKVLFSKSKQKETAEK